jgi:hypothetical protein
MILLDLLMIVLFFREMQPVRPLFYFSVINTQAFIIGSHTVHVWLNPMKD